MSKVREIPLITVKAINRNIVEQIYPTRGELTSSPYDDLGPEWLEVGKLATTGDVLLRNANTGEVRLCWLWRYAATKQAIKDPLKVREFQATVSNNLATIYIG